MHYRQIFRVDSPVPKHPRWVKNVTEEAVDVMYDSVTYTLKPGEVVYTDMAVATLLINQCRQYNFDKESGAILGEKGNLLKEFTEDPGVSSVEDERIGKVPEQKAVVIEDVVPEQATKLDTMKMPDLRKMASLLGLTVDIKTKKVDLIALIKAAQK